VFEERLCGYCGTAMITVKTARNITYRKVKGVTNHYHLLCRNCGDRCEHTWQLAVNRDNMLYFHRLVDLKDTPWLSEAIKNP